MGKLVKGLRKGEDPLDKFYNANINLATGSQAMNVFRPEPTVKLQTKLTALPEYTTWEKIDIQGESSVKVLVEQLRTSYGCTVKRLFPIGNDKVTLFEDIQLEKLNWKIELQADGKCVVEPEAVFSTWPQLRMAVQ